MSESKVIKLSDIADLDLAVAEIQSVMEKDGVVLIATDTVYGLICMPRRPAVEKVFKMKERPMSFNLPIIVANKEQAAKMLPTKWTDEAEKLASKYWPGAMTLAVGLRENDIEWLCGRVEVGIRVPDAPLIIRMAEKMGPLLMTSANRHGVPTPHTAEGALNSLAFAPDLIVDGGELSGAPSTLVNCNLPKPVCERIGSVSAEEVERTLNS